MRIPPGVVVKREAYNTAEDKARRTQHRANGTWCSPIQRHRDGTKSYRVHHSGDMFGSVSEVSVKRSQRAA